MYDMYNLYCDSRTNAINLIEKCQNKIREEEKKIEECNFNIDSYKLRMLNNIHDLYIVVPYETLDILWRGFRKDKFDDAESKKKYKSAYDFVKHIIETDIIGDTKCSYKKTKLINDIVACGYDTYAFSIKFIVNDITFVIEIPVVKHIHVENYIYAHYGKYTLYYYSSQYCQDYIESSYDLNNIQKAFKEFIEKENNNV